MIKLKRILIKLLKFKIINPDFCFQKNLNVIMKNQIADHKSRQTKNMHNFSGPSEVKIALR